MAYRHDDYSRPGLGLAILILLSPPFHFSLKCLILRTNQGRRQPK